MRRFHFGGNHLKARSLRLETYVGHHDVLLHKFLKRIDIGFVVHGVLLKLIVERTKNLFLVLLVHIWLDGPRGHDVCKVRRHWPLNTELEVNNLPPARAFLGEEDVVSLWICDQDRVRTLSQISYHARE